MNFLHELRSVVGDRGMVAKDNTGQFLVDWGGKNSGEALAVVRPANTQQVSEVVALCNLSEVAIVPQGGNTGLCAGATPLPTGHPQQRDCIVLSLSRMNQIESINVDRSTVTVQAGVTIQDLQEATAAQGLLFAPDWGARGTAQIGGGISTNAGGLNVLRWGGMREQILGLEVVLADGRVFDGLRALRKDSTGLDLKHLFIATEGTLGVVTKAVLKLHPLPSESQTALAALSGLDSLMPFFAHARQTGGSLISAFELLPEDGMWRVLERQPKAQRPLADKSEWYVLIRMSGGAEVSDAMAQLLSSAAEAELISDAAVAATPEQEENLWFIRDEVPPTTSFDALGNRHKFDIAIPTDRVGEFIEESADLMQSMLPGLKTFAFGHIGDGNLHFNIYPGPDCDVKSYESRGPELERAIDELTWSYGGSISAEHGVGTVMLDRMERQKSDVELSLMRTIKNALDPNGILNPGKVVPVDLITSVA